MVKATTTLQAGIQVPNSGRDRVFLLSVHPAFCLMGTGFHFQGLNWPGRDVDHSPPSDEAKHERRCTSPPPICLHCAEMGKFTFILLPEAREI